MTANDNIRHYIGDLEATDDIDVVFKHIYDLMLANGGENSRLNADMVDGYHASDFAPASLKDEIDRCIHSITLGGQKYSGADVILEMLASKVLFYQSGAQSPTNVEDFLNSLDSRVLNTEDSISDMSDAISFLSNEEMQDALTHIIQNNINNITDDEGDVLTYFNADSVNGLSFQILTQDEYDILPNELKLDPHNIFIINNDIGNSSQNYTPPSILQAGMNLEFRINTSTNNIEFSVDGKKQDNPNKIWKVLLPLVGASSNKGILYPEWFSLIKEVINANQDLGDQSNYPFLLNTPENKADLAQEFSGDKIDGITIGNNTIQPTNDNNAVNISDALNDYINTWISTHASTIKSTINLENTINNIIQQKNHELMANKLTSDVNGGISGNANDTKYPTTKAVYNYVESVKNTLQNNINAMHLDSGWKKEVAYEKFFQQDANSTNKAYVWFRKIGPVVYVTATMSTRTTINYEGVDNYRFLCNIPQGFKPAITCRIIGQASQTDRCYIYTDITNNALKIGRFDYQNKRTGYYTLPKGYWITFSGTYLV